MSLAHGPPLVFSPFGGQPLLSFLPVHHAVADFASSEKERLLMRLFIVAAPKGSKQANAAAKAVVKGVSSKLDF